VNRMPYACLSIFLSALSAVICFKALSHQAAAAGPARSTWLPHTVQPSRENDCDTMLQIICGGQMWRGLWGASPTLGHPGACPAITPSKVRALCKHTHRQALTHSRHRTCANNCRCTATAHSTKGCFFMFVCMSADMMQGLMHTQLLLMHS